MTQEHFTLTTGKRSERKFVAVLTAASEELARAVAAANFYADRALAAAQQAHDRTVEAAEQTHATTLQKAQEDADKAIAAAKQQHAEAIQSLTQNHTQAMARAQSSYSAAWADLPAAVAALYQAVGYAAAPWNDPAWQAWSPAADGAPPWPGRVMLRQKKSWFQWPPPLLRTASGSFDMRAIRASSVRPRSDASAATARLRLST